MAERREIDLFAFIFNSDGEEDEPTAEPQDEDAPLVDLTVDSDEDGASNSAAVIQQNQPQSSSRLSRSAQTALVSCKSQQRTRKTKKKKANQTD